MEHLRAMQEQNQQIVGLVSALLEQNCPTSTSADPSSPAPRTDIYGDLVRDLLSFSYEDDKDATFDVWFEHCVALIDIVERSF